MSSCLRKTLLFVQRVCFVYVKQQLYWAGTSDCPSRLPPVGSHGRHDGHAKITPRKNIAPRADEPPIIFWPAKLEHGCIYSINVPGRPAHMSNLSFRYPAIAGPSWQRRARGGLQLCLLGPTPVHKPLKSAAATGFGRWCF